jgi:NAD(P)-dependent dehydrogenase (short-subunit alcohol dehydrogenase family)
VRKEKIVLISGASGGLGKALVRIFSDFGYYVIATDVRSPATATIAQSTEIIYKIINVTDPAQILSLRKELKLDHSGLDILICAAGIYNTFPVTEADPDLFREMMAVNLHGTANLIQGMLVPLIQNKGRVIVVSSESFKIQALFQPYMISKAALEAYCRSARQELSLKDVKLSVIRPGAINTPLLDWMKSTLPSENYPVFSKELLISWKRSIKMVGTIIPPEKAARMIFKAATTHRPKRVYRINNSFLLNIASLLPGFILDKMINRIFR